MFVGHYGIGLALKSADKKLNLGWIFLATMMPDILLGVFVLSGIEKVKIPDNYPQLHYFLFDFPLSHSLGSTIICSVIIMILVKVFWPNKVSNKSRVAVILALTYFSHFLLDTIVHIPEIPLLGNNSHKIGLGLWNVLPVELILELCIALFGLLIYLKVNKDKSNKSKIGISIIVLILSLFTLSQAISPMPTVSMVIFIAIQWIVSGIGVSLLAFWIDNDGRII
jgi:membrane-bound metal-dependent hydrolase YbcI (DUF457 family)